MQAIVIDLDKTLITQSTTTIELREIIGQLGLIRTFRNAFEIGTLRRIVLKNWISCNSPNINYSKYVNHDVVKKVNKLRSADTKVILATASLPDSVSRFLEYSPIKFDFVITSTETRTIKGKRKLAQIQEYNIMNQIDNFIYFGDSRHDFHIFKLNSRGYFLGPKLIYSIGKNFYRLKNLELIK
jgi:phosphoserine phosphatase